MIIASLSGKRLIPFYIGSFPGIVTDGLQSFVFPYNPVVQLIVPDGTTLGTFTIEGTGGFSQAETPTETTFDYRGTTYRAYTINEHTSGLSQLANGTGFYYQFVYEPLGANVTYRSAPFNIEGFSTVACRNFSLEYGMACNNYDLGENGFTNKVFFKNLQALPTTIETFEEGEEDGFGIAHIDYQKKRTLYRFQFVCTPMLFERMSYADMYDTLTLKDLDNGVSYSVDPNTFVVEGDAEADGPEFIATITFSILNDEACRQGCDDDVYADSPYPDECVDQSEPGFDCTGFAVSINSASFPTLSATVTPPAGGGTVTVTWYRNNEFLSQGNSIMIAQPGSYKAIASHPSCSSVQDTYLYEDQCALFDVEATVTGTVLTANFVGVPPAETVTLEVLDSGGLQVATALPYDATPDGTDTYTLRYQTTSCGPKDKAVYINTAAGNECYHTVSITRNGDVFEGNVSGLLGGETVTYVWERIDTDDVSTQVATTQNYTPTVSGIYVFKCIVDGCEKTAQKLYLSSQKVEIINDPLIVSGLSKDYIVEPLYSGVTVDYITANSGTLPDPANYSVSEIRRKVRVKLNNTWLDYVDPTTHINNFRIDAGTNRIYFHAALDALDNVYLEYEE